MVQKVFIAMTQMALQCKLFVIRRWLGSKQYGWFLSLRFLQESVVDTCVAFLGNRRKKKIAKERFAD